MLISRSTPEKIVIELGKIDCRSKKCVHCCKYGSGFLADGEEERIARFLKITKEGLINKYLEEGEKFNTKRLKPKLLKEKSKPYGKCIFLDENKGCTIHEVKPMQCRIGSCSHHSSDLQKWFDLKFFINPKDAESVRQYALWLEFNEPLPGASLQELVPDKERLRKILSYEIYRF